MDLEALCTGTGVGAGAGYLICSKIDVTGAGGACTQSRAKNEPPVPCTL